MTVVFTIIVVLTASHCCHRLICQILLNPREYDSCHHYHPDHELGASVAKQRTPRFMNPDGSAVILFFPQTDHYALRTTTDHNFVPSDYCSTAALVRGSFKEKYSFKSSFHTSLVWSSSIFNALWICGGNRHSIVILDLGQVHLYISSPPHTAFDCASSGIYIWTYLWGYLVISGLPKFSKGQLAPEIKSSPWN